MKQFEAVIDFMEKNGGFATLGQLYQNVDVSGWKTKTPFASIRRIVQDDKFFFKIKPGLWALKSYKNDLPFSKELTGKKQDEFNHTYYQGLLVELGNLQNLQTFVPHQDKNKKFLDRKLADLIQISDFFKFTYEHLTKKAMTIDVSWFNQRKMPDSFFEIEHSTDFQNSLLKFTELQDFRAKFYIVADEARKREYESKISYSVFLPIKDRVKFVGYEYLSELHAFEFKKLERGLRL